MKALETTGRIEKSGLLKLDRPLVISGKQKVKVIILYAEEEDIDESDWLTSLRGNASFAFLKNKRRIFIPSLMECLCWRMSNIIKLSLIV